MLFTFLKFFYLPTYQQKIREYYLRATLSPGDLLGKPDCIVREVLDQLAVPGVLDVACEVHEVTLQRL